MSQVLVFDGWWLQTGSS